MIETFYIPIQYIPSQTAPTARAIRGQWHVTYDTNVMCHMALGTLGGIFNWMVRRAVPEMPYCIHIEVLI